jgi:hypothetical protein
MRNALTLEDVFQMDIDKISALEIDELASLIDELETEEAILKQIKNRMNLALDKKFSDQATKLRIQAGKDTGIVNIHVGNFIVKADLPKKPEWDQAKLKESLKTIEEWGGYIDEYVTTEYKVSEAKYKAWPTQIRECFEPARTLKTGKPTYTIERKKED